jgi:predicted nuclease with TOPRIM domain
MKADSLKLNFEIALEKIDTLTKQNNELLDKIDELETELKKVASELKNRMVEPTTADDLRIKRFDTVNKEADAAMKRFTAKLRKEIKNAKSKQSQGQSV